MKTKILRYGVYPRQNQVVTACEEVTFENEYMGWYVSQTNEQDHRWDELAVVVRIGTVCAELDCMMRDTVLQKQYIERVTFVAQHFREYIRQIMDKGGWVQSLHIEIFRALGWDAAPLIAYRRQLVRRREQEHREQARLKNEQDRMRQQAACERSQKELSQAQEQFAKGQMIAPELFIALCRQHGVALHPRTLGTLRSRITRIGPEKVGVVSFSKTKKLPGTDGCFAAAKLLLAKLK